MSDPQRSLIASILQAEFKSLPDPSTLEVFSIRLGLPGTLVRDVAEELWPTSEPVSDEALPFILIHLRSNPRPGQQMIAECTVRYAGWDGQVAVRPRLMGPLDALMDDEFRLITEDPNSGYWIFHQSLSLTKDGYECQAGEYVLYYDCHFHQGAGIDTKWTGWVKFRVHDEREEKVLNVETDGLGKINLNGIDFGSFSRMNFRANGEGCINAQACIAELSRATRLGSDSTATTSVIPIQLKPIGGVVPPPRPVSAARLDLPSEQRILLYTRPVDHDQLILGRNRARQKKDGPNERTDISLRMLPSSPSNDAISMKISRQHLGIGIESGLVSLKDLRSRDQQAAKPAKLDGKPLPSTPMQWAPGRPSLYSTDLGPSEQIGLHMTVYEELDRLQYFTQLLEGIRRVRDDEPWSRDATGMDALMIDRYSNPDDLNGRESYLLVMGIALIGSGEECPVRIFGPGVELEHAALCHWDGQFRLVALHRAKVICDGKPLQAGHFVTLKPHPGHRIQIGDVELLFAPWEQLGI